MSPPGRPKGEHRSAQHEGTPVRPPGRPQGEYCSAQHEGTPVSQAREWTQAGAAHIDVRGLPPPQPLVAILRRVRTLGPREELIVHHERDPLLLYPELAEIGWEAERIAAPAGEVRLRLRSLP